MKNIIKFCFAVFAGLTLTKFLLNLLGVGLTVKAISDFADDLHET